MIASIYLVRHGETAWSLSGQHTSQTDIPLTASGEQQARRLGRLLGAVRFDRVLVSPLQRARRTCELAGLWVNARVEQRLSEWNYGDYEGRTPAEIHAQRPGWDVFRDGCPGGESTDDLSARADALLASLLPLKGSVALFSHGHFLRALAARWTGLPVSQGRHFCLDPGSLSILGLEHHDAGVPAVLLWNARSNEVFDLTPHTP